MPELTFTSASNEDIPVIFHFCKDLIDAYEDVTSIDYEKVLQWVEKKISESISSYTCVRSGADKVGYYRLIRQEDGWELDDFYVLPQYRNCGIGTQILQKCLRDIDGPIFLYVFKKNYGAIRLYERNGFCMSRQVGSTRMVMRRDG